MIQHASFGQWVKEMRRAHGWSRIELARLVCCAPITLRKIEADQLRPSKDLARIILERFEVASTEEDELMQKARERFAHGFFSFRRSN